MFKVGTAITDITPINPQYMCGYIMRTEKSKGVQKDLAVTALTLEVNEQKIILITADIIIVDEEMSSSVRKVLAEKYGLSEKMINVGALHTHSAPIVSEELESNEGQIDKKYRQYVISQMIQAGIESVDCLKEIDETYYRYGKIEGLYSNRNDKSNDGDKWIHLIDFKNNGQLIASIVNFSCHGTILGPDNYTISADLPGEIRRGIKARTGVSPLMMNGNSGDMSNRQYREGNDIKELERVGTSICKQIFAFREERKINIYELSFNEVNQHIQYIMNKDNIKESITKSNDKLLVEQNYDKRKLLKSGISFLEGRLKRDESDVNITITSLIYKLGDLSIVTIPGELYSYLGLKLKSDSDYKPTLIFGYANNFNAGYLVCEKEYGDSYESVTTEVPKGKPEELIDEITGYLKKQS